MNERQLAYLVAAVDEGSFTHAAARCRVSQPSLSAAIARLERELGVLLFHRIGRRVVPTDACLALLPAAHDVLRSGEVLRNTARDAREVLSGHLEIAVQPTVVGAVVDRLAAFRTRFPSVALRVRSPADDSVALLVTSGRAELGLGEIVGPHPDVVWHELWTEAYVCVDRANEPDGSNDGSHGAGAACTPADLASVPLIAAPNGAPTRTVLEQWLATANVAGHVEIEIDHREALIPLVAAGGGAAVVPRSVATAANDTTLRVRSLDPPVERRIGLLHRPRGLTPAAERFVTLALEHAP